MMCLICYQNIFTLQLILDLGWDRFVQTSSKAWNDFYIQWMKNAKDVLLISYEDLMDDCKLKDILKNISNFLDFEVSSRRLACTIKYRKGMFQRNKICYELEDLEYIPDTKLSFTKSTFSVFTEKHRSLINSAIRNVSNQMANSGYSCSPISEYVDTKVYIDICK